MKSYKPLTVFYFVVALFLGSWAHAAPDDGVSLSEAIRLTLKNNPQFQTYRLRADALQGELQTAQLKPGLRVNSEIENVLGTGDLNWFQGTEITLSLSQVIEFGDKRSARANVVNQRQNVLRAEQQILELNLLSEVATRYIELAAAEETASLLEQYTQLAADILSNVSARVEAGRTPEAARYRAAAALTRAELDAQSASYRNQAASISLSSLWGGLSSQHQSQAELMQIVETADMQSLLAALEKNPAIQVFVTEARLKEAELRQARSQRSSNIEVGAGLRHLAELNDTAITFQLSMPLSTKRRAQGAITAAQANLLRVDSERETAVLRMKAQLLTLEQLRLLAVNEFTALQDLVVPQLNNALAATRTAFENGRYSYIEMSAAQKELLDSQLALINAAARSHLIRIEIERLSGETLGRSSGETSQ
ncbi:MAG: TolC family protein [Gammaproteobacteria bacterium]|nr:TolC family protein [Gammaproteobacteria bacterium]